MIDRASMEKRRGGRAGLSRVTALVLASILGAPLPAAAQPIDDEEDRRGRSRDTSAPKDSDAAKDTRNDADAPKNAGADAAKDADVPKDPEVEQAIAQALVRRGQELAAAGDYQDAKLLTLEALERTKQGAAGAGPVHDEALSLLRTINQKLGLPELDSAPHSGGQTDPAEGPLDPYGSDGIDVGEAPLDPYGDMGEENKTDNYDPFDDIGPDQDDAEVPPPLADKGPRNMTDATRRGLLLHGGIGGFVLGMALGGPISKNEYDEESISGGAFLLGLAGAGGGALAAHYLGKRAPLSPGQAAALRWSGIYGMTTFGFLADVFTGVDTSTTNEVWKGTALGALVGTGVGIAIARKYDPSEGDVALTTSLGTYGGLGGLLLGAVMEPPESEAYSLNAAIGTTVGLGVGYYAAKRLEVSRRRMFWVDIGAFAGATVPWVLLYPLLDSGSDGDSGSAAQATGLISLLGLAGGGYLAWRVSSKLDAQPRAAKDELAAVPGLLQRTEKGAWQLGAPMLRPAHNPRLAPRLRGDIAVAVDLVGGQF